MATGAEDGGQSHNIVIGLREVYDELRGLSKGTERLDAKLDTAINSHSIRMEAMAADIKDQGIKQEKIDARLHVLEVRPVVEPKNMWIAVAALTGVFGIFVTIILFVVSVKK